MEWVPEEVMEFRQTSLRGPAARRYQDSLQQSQGRFVDTVLSRRIEVLDRRSFLLNMLLVRGSRKVIEELGHQEEVKGIYPNPERFLLMDAAPTVVGAPDFWQAVGGIGNAGRNISIGIIDSGINPAHPMFGDDGLNAPLMLFFQCPHCGDPEFTNNKVIVARTYVKPVYGLNPQLNTTPEDELGHGSQVASVAAGKPVAAPLAQIQGIAPFAFLGNYKVFGTPGINSTTTSAAVIAAINDTVADGMNVLGIITNC